MSNDNYYNFGRDELLDLIPANSQKILDCGCANGNLGKLIKNRQKCIVVGIEQNRKSCNMARANIDYIIKDDLNTFDFPILKTDFDCIIFADVLEHLLCPTCTLTKAIEKLTPSGTVVASIPNIAHPYIMQQLNLGLFRYTSAGILDRTHYRFFTQTTIFQMFARAGLKITNIRPYPSHANPIQYHITAKKIYPSTIKPILSIVALTYNCLHHTQEFIESLRKYADVPYQLYIVDNCSTDGTQKYLREQKDILHIENTFNLGFANGNNIALELITTPYILLANNDTIVSKQSLSRLINTLEKNDKNGLAGPISNYVSGAQIDKEAKYTSAQELETYAELKASTNTAETEETKRLVFFFVMIKKAVFDTIGLLDERFRVGNFEDDDFSIRAQQAGFKLHINRNVFIHHYGSKTWKENKLDYNKYMLTNRDIFIAKYQNITSKP